MTSCCSTISILPFIKKRSQVGLSCDSQNLKYVPYISKLCKKFFTFSLFYFLTILPKGAYGVNLGCFGTFGTFRAFVACTSLYKLVQACTSPKKFLAGLLM